MDSDRGLYFEDGDLHVTDGLIRTITVLCTAFNSSARQASDRKRVTWYKNAEMDDYVAVDMAPAFAMKAPDIIQYGKADKRSRISHLFQHIGAGSVKYISSYSSGTGATHMIGVVAAHLVSYSRGDTGVIWGGNKKPYHIIQIDDFQTAHLEAVKRSLVHEVQVRLNTRSLCSLSTPLLQNIYTQLKPRTKQ